MTYTRHSGPLRSKGPLTCQTYSDMEHLFIMVISRGPMTLTPIAKHLSVELALFLRHTACRCWDTQPSACEANALTDCASAAVILIEFVL